MESKAEIRKRILEVRRSLTVDEVEVKSEAILQNVLKTPEYIEADNILLYADHHNEVITRGIFEDALMRNKRVYFPKSDSFTNTMVFYRTTSIAQLEKGFMGILEPKENIQHRYRFCANEDTLVILPGVAFDTAGFRIGYGKGYYDKFLSSKRQLSTMALAFACQIVEELPREAHDIKMDKIVTEEIIYSFLRI
ncbi:MAG: 5-formyltetrahydrofolate cyclo-ligase [Lachnospiraceae bacterium]|nr:5-formyltetrahydrofolate cyclo-ligase [Lachnospiraceae bacterium]